MTEEKVDKEAVFLKRLNVYVDMPQFRSRLHEIKGGTHGCGKDIKSGYINGTNLCFSYYEDKSTSGTKYVMTSDLVPMEKIMSSDIVSKMNNMTIKNNHTASGGSKIPKEVDLGLEGIEGTDDIDSWGGKKKTEKKTAVKPTQTKKKTITKKKCAKLF